MKVYLVRHGKALPPATDPAQPLSEEGRSDISHLARTLRNMNFSVELIVHSGKLRAEETAKIIADSINPSKGIKAVKGLAPKDDITEALKIIEAQHGDLMIVSHLPFLEHLLEAMVKPEGSEELPAFDIGNVIGLEKSGERWQVFRHLGPKMIL
ncbi:MAG TPA: phosphohistidine phosphatase SixA [archaeon]|nr:phosphohistidine phosphatase SixA [archaeon]